MRFPGPVRNCTFATSYAVNGSDGVQWIVVVP